MRTLLFKRTHIGDPSQKGIFGIDDCMGRVRGYEFDSAIGIGGRGGGAKAAGIGGKIIGSASAAYDRMELPMDDVGHKLRLSAFV